MFARYEKEAYQFLATYRFLSYALAGLPPKNCTSYNVRKTKSVKRGELDGKERLHTGTDYK